MPNQNSHQENPDRKDEPDCFQMISREDLESLVEKRTHLRYLKGETIFKQGAFAPYVLFIQSGLVKAYLQTGRSKLLNLWIAHSGDFLAFSSIFGERVHTYSAMAIIDTEILMIEKESLGRLLGSNPEFAMKITSKNYRTEKHLLDIITNLSYKQMRGKLASSLLYLHSKIFGNDQIFNYLTRQDIADFSSISVESVIKFLKEFEKEGIIVLEGKNIVILDGKKLEEISNTG